MIFKKITLTLFIYFALIFPATAAENYFAKVTKLWDADSFHVKKENGTVVHIRLANIDTPEKDQPHGMKAKEVMQDLILNKTILIQPVSSDRYKRTIANAYIDDISINYWLVKEGHAWVYRRYNREAVLLEAEAEAKRHKRGLWQTPDPIAPWKWRKANK